MNKERETIFKLITEILDESTYHLQVEIIYTALLFLKENPAESIEAALYHGINEWVK